MNNNQEELFNTLKELTNEEEFDQLVNKWDNLDYLTKMVVKLFFNEPYNESILSLILDLDNRIIEYMFNKKVEELLND